MRFRTPSPILFPSGVMDLWDSEELNTLLKVLSLRSSGKRPVGTDSHWEDWRCVTSILFALEREPALTNLAEVEDAIRGLKVGNAPVPNVIPNRALQQLPQNVAPYFVKVMTQFLECSTSGQHANIPACSPETREGPAETLVVSTRKSVRHDWQADGKYPTY
jgi:hypothetical protein